MLGGLVALAVIVAEALPAGADPTSPQPAGSGTNTQMIMSGTGPGQSVTGFIANPTNPLSTPSSTATPQATRRRASRRRTRASLGLFLG